MNVMLVTVLLICISHCVYSHDDIAECIFAINSSIYIKKPPFSGRIVQNVGETEVQVTSIAENDIIEPGHKRIFYFSMNISNLQSEKRRAIVYVSNCNNDSKVYIGEPEAGYNKYKVLWKTANLGVKHIPEHTNLSTLISNFWPENKENVWQQIYAVIKDLLDDKTKQTISKILNKNIKDIKEEMVALNNITEQNMNNEDFKIKYMKLNNKLNNFETNFTLEDHKIFNLYIIPLYTNVVTMKMYFYSLGLIRNKTGRFTTICQTVLKQLKDSSKYLESTRDKALDEIYDTGYPGDFYNVMMNARSYSTWHAYELFTEWNKVYFKCFNAHHPSTIFLPISFSNLYGRATPNLLTIGIHYNPKYYFNPIKELIFYIQSEEQVKTVYGIEIFVPDNEYSDSSLGNCKLARNISSILLELNEKRIIKLKVYKTMYIRCLEFRLSDKTTSIFGDHCEDNSENSEFYLEGHYIYNFFLANDYPETGKYFDNVAVQYLPNES